MIAPLLMTALAALPILDAQQIQDAVPIQDQEVVGAKPADWKGLVNSGFDARWILPDANPDGALDLAAELAAMRFTDGPEELRSLGDLWEASSVMSQKQIDALLARFAKEHSTEARRLGGTLAELLARRGLFGRRWDPDEDSANDAMALQPDHDLSRNDRAPWNDLSGNSNLHQALVLVRGDEQDWLAATHHYDRYPDHVNAQYKAIHAIRDRHLVGESGPRGPFRAVKIALTNDLPFPFGDYTGHIWILHRMDKAGRLVMDVQSRSRCFRWLAGQDVLLPIARGDGTRVGTLVLRRYGFELCGVPEKAKHRKAALRASLGNLVRETEALRRLRGGPPEGPGGDCSGPERAGRRPSAHPLEAVNAEVLPSDWNRSTRRSTGRTPGTAMGIRCHG